MPRKCDEVTCEDRGYIPEVWRTDGLEILIFFCERHHEKSISRQLGDEYYLTSRGM